MNETKCIKSSSFKQLQTKSVNLPSNTIFERYWIFQTIPKVFKAVQMYWNTAAKYYKVQNTCPKRFLYMQQWFRLSVFQFSSKAVILWGRKYFLDWQRFKDLIFQIIWCSKLSNSFHWDGHHSTWIILVRSSALDLGTEWDNPVNICLRFCQ